MSRTSTLILLGFLTVLAPFSGLPIAFRDFLAVVFGACVAGIGLSMRAHEARHTMDSVSGEARSVQPPPPEIPLAASEPAPPRDISPI